MPRDAERVGRVCDALGRIGEQRPGESTGLPGLVDGKAAEDRDGDRVGHVAPEPSGGIRGSDCSRCQGVIGDDAVVLGDDEGTSCAADLVCPRPALQPEVQGRHSRGERREVMDVGERFRG